MQKGVLTGSFRYDSQNDKACMQCSGLGLSRTALPSFIMQCNLLQECLSTSDFASNQPPLKSRRACNCAFADFNFLTHVVAVARR